jgi:release factor glutamine methyltransferase
MAEEVVSEPLRLDVRREWLDEEGITVSSALAHIEVILRGTPGFETASRYAQLLLSAALSVDPAEVSRMGHDGLSARAASFLGKYLACSPLVPVPLYLGYCHVDGVRIELSEAVLTPGTETDRMFDVATELASRVGARYIADVGTGCGKIAIVLARRLPSATLHATDCSREALEVARRNVELCGLEERVRCHLGEWLDPLRSEGLVAKIDLVVSNPPYCKEGDLARLPSGFAAFAPTIAINGGPDGLACHRSVIEGAAEFLRVGGWLLLQTDEGQAGQVAECIKNSGAFGEPYFAVGSHRTPRFVYAKRWV